MSRVRFRQTTSTNLPRYKKKPKPSHVSTTMQQSAANMLPSELFEWDDILNDQISTGFNGEQQYNSLDTEDIHFNSSYLNAPDVQSLESNDNDDDNNNDNDNDDIVNQEIDDDDDSMTNQEEISNALPSFKTYDGSSYIPHFQGEYGPYFPSFTAMALFIWVTKHMISSAAYEGLVSILLHEKFRVEDVIKSIRSIKRFRNGLPLLTIKSHNVEISSKDTPSTSKESKEAYFFSVTDHIKRILSNPKLKNDLYFGEGIESDSKSEFWHGELWQRSPLFGAECCHHNNELPRTYARSRQDSRQLWLTENLEIIELSQIINKVSVWLYDTQQPLSYEFIIKEILYYHNARLLLRDISLRHHHSTLSALSRPDFHCRRIKIFCDLYFDDFGTYRNVYHSLGGLYLQFGNMKLKSRQKLRNHFLVGFVPFGGKFEDAIKLFIQDIQHLERGFLMTIDNQQVWISGGLGITTADLPQGNDLAGTLRHNATHGCRTCKASRDDFTDISFDISKHGRYHHLTDIEFENIQCLPNRSQKHALASSLGLRLIPNPLDQLIRDRHISTPQDIFHCFAGKANRLLIATFGLLTNSGEDTFTRIWKFFEVPSCWSRRQNPITHLASYFMSDILRLTMIIPFILRRCLTSDLLKREALMRIKERMDLRSHNYVINRIIKCWVQFSLTARMVFSRTLTNENYETIQKMLELECKMLLEIFPEQFSGLPNLHINRHIVAHAKTYGTAFNTSVSIKEMVHRIHKGVVPHTNKKNVEFDLIKRDNTLQTLRYLLDGGQDIRFEHMIIGQGIQNIVNDVALRPLLDNWYITSSLLSKTYDDDDVENTNIVTCIPEIMDINVRSKWNKHQRDQENFTVGKHLNEYFFNELANAYAEYYNDRGAMINSKVEFYNNISYVVKDDDGFVDVQLSVGDVVDVFEEGETEESYAIIKGIFTHERSRKLHAFVIFDWFEKIGENTLLKCPKYRLQASEETRWNRIFPISLIDHNSRVHFVHDCNGDCNYDRHNLSNHLGWVSEERKKKTNLNGLDLGSLSYMEFRRSKT
ncbi:hypothetical protein GLOIN_2v1764038 [Rhizophagus irregularis DAOM 181602=DAOM 197198]|nr:hypothetical protein GLOIN_2v1764038 [Rhizophagus irregularis DAOM 181602=DAOM 197198]